VAPSGIDYIYWLDCSLLGAIGNALYESTGRSLHRPTYAYY